MYRISSAFAPRFIPRRIPLIYPTRLAYSAKNTFDLPSSPPSRIWPISNFIGTKNSPTVDKAFRGIASSGTGILSQLPTFKWPGLQRPPKTLTLTFGDSGAGGLIYMLESTRVMMKPYVDLCERLNIKIRLVHLGDGTHAPFGNRPPEEIQQLTKQIIAYCAHQEKSQIIGIKCNTASTIFDNHMWDHVSANYPGTDVIEIIEPTARILRTQVQPTLNGDKFEYHIGILATRATVMSQKYHIELARLHQKEYGDSAVTVVINSDKFIFKKLTEQGKEFARVYVGNRPLPRGCYEETQIFKQINNNELTCPVQFLHVHAPSIWVSIIEGKDEFSTLDPAKKKEILDDSVVREMNLFFKHSAKFFKNRRANPGNRVSVIGLCCTHFPYVKDGITDALKVRGLSGSIELISQGESISKLILPGIIESQLRRLGVEERARSLFSNTVPDISLESKTTVNQSNPIDFESARVVKDVGHLIHPELAKRVRFSSIDPIPTLENWQKSTESVGAFVR